MSNNTIIIKEKSKELAELRNYVNELKIATAQVKEWEKKEKALKETIKANYPDQDITIILEQDNPVVLEIKQYTSKRVDLDKDKLQKLLTPAEYTSCQVVKEIKNVKFNIK